jgi:jasmonate O-methyltransferase
MIEAVASLLNDPYPGGLAIADLGCSSGPNTLVLVSTAVDAVRRRCSELRQQPPELCIHLNDLPSNDFNLVIRSLATKPKKASVLSSPASFPAHFTGGSSTSVAFI